MLVQGKEVGVGWYRDGDKVLEIERGEGWRTLNEGKAGVVQGLEGRQGGVGADPGKRR